jgi:transcriptional regulator with XRE-family HTH domain
MLTSRTAETFSDLLLRFRGRSGLTQHQLADRVGVNRRSVQEWENGANYPGADRLEALIRVLLEAHGLEAGHEAGEAQALWAAVQREAPRMHASFDQAWFARLLAEHATRDDVPVVASTSSPARPVERLAEWDETERRQDWGEAPDTTVFVGRGDVCRLRPCSQSSTRRTSSLSACGRLSSAASRCVNGAIARGDVGGVIMRPPGRARGLG